MNSFGFRKVDVSGSVGDCADKGIGEVAQTVRQLLLSSRVDTRVSRGYQSE